MSLCTFMYIPDIIVHIKDNILSVYVKDFKGVIFMEKQKISVSGMSYGELNLDMMVHLNYVVMQHCTSRDPETGHYEISSECFPVASFGSSYEAFHYVGEHQITLNGEELYFVAKVDNARKTVSNVGYKEFFEKLQSLNYNLDSKL